MYDKSITEWTPVISEAQWSCYKLGMITQITQSAIWYEWLKHIYEISFTKQMFRFITRSLSYDFLPQQVRTFVFFCWWYATQNLVVRLVKLTDLYSSWYFSFPATEYNPTTNGIFWITRKEVQSTVSEQKHSRIRHHLAHFSDIYTIVLVAQNKHFVDFL